MERIGRIFVFALVLSAVAANIALAVQVDILPTASLYAFDPVTFTYVYRVICPENMTQPFGYFQVDANVWEFDPYVTETGFWGISGPFTPAYPGGVNQDWECGVFPWCPMADSAYWRADGDEEIMPGTAWQGDFVLVVPNTQPGPGYIYTANGVPQSYQAIVDLVPCPAPIPEPSGLLALSVGALSVATFWKRR